MSFIEYPQQNVLSHSHTVPPCLLFFVKERYRISKSTHIYFIQIYIEFKYYISIWSFDTNQENPTIFNGKDMCIYSNGHIITSIIQPLPSHPCLLLTVELQWQKATGVRVLYLYCKKLKIHLLCIQGTEGVAGRGETSEQRLLTRPGSKSYLPCKRACLF